jgi:UDP-N-acetylglucosamine 1-carboxyvinyltransferase
MGAAIGYHSENGYFDASTDGLKGAEYTFEKNTHTGTETLIIAAATATGTTIIKNAAEEPEIDDLIAFLNSMGAKIKRSSAREVTIEGVSKLHGTTYSIMSDSNEIVTWAILAALSGGNISVAKVDAQPIAVFLEKFKEAGGNYEIIGDTYRFYVSDIKALSIQTGIYPGFMTDWQGPWALFETQGRGVSVIHETIYENRFGYVSELKKMGAKITFFTPQVDNPSQFYNFNIESGKAPENQAVEISGPTTLHDAIVKVTDLRAGATLVLASLIAKGKTILYGVEQIERGYEDFAGRLRSLGADIQVVEEA